MCVDVAQYKYPAYIANMLAKGPEAMAKELDRLQTKIVKAQNAAAQGLPVNAILRD